MWHKLVIAGYLGRDPEMRYLQDNTPVTNFSVAINDGFGDNKKTIWIRVAAFGKRAEVANQYLSKGSQVLVEGRLTADNYGNPNTFEGKHGVQASFEMRADNLTFIGSRDDASHEETESAPKRQQQQQQRNPVEDDDIPF